jgi:hypothetical protein
MKKISRWLISLIVMVFWLHAATGQDELDLYSNQQPPRIETMPETALPVPDTDTGSTRFEPNRDVSDIPTTEVFISPTRSKSVTRTISRPTISPQQNPAVMDPMIAPMIVPGYRPYPPR